MRKHSRRVSKRLPGRFLPRIWVRGRFQSEGHSRADPSEVACPPVQGESGRNRFAAPELLSRNRRSTRDEQAPVIAAVTFAPPKPSPASGRLAKSRLVGDVRQAPLRAKIPRPKNGR